MIERESAGESQKKPRLIYKDVWVVPGRPDLIDPCEEVEGEEPDLDSLREQDEFEHRDESPTEDYENGEDRFFES